jgi:hypothetical protein
VLIDGYFKIHPTLAQWWNSKNGEPPLTDTQALLLALMQASFGGTTKKY